MTSAAFDVLGIGNAIVDVISQGDEAFLKKHALVTVSYTHLTLPTTERV